MSLIVRTLTLGALGVLSTFALSCSGTAPTTSQPTTSVLTPPTDATLPPGQVAFGALDVILDPATLAIETLPGRSSLLDIGDTINELGATGKLKEFDALAIESIDRISDSEVEVRLAITHPFPLAERPDLAVFNLKVHVVSEGSETFGATIAHPGLLANADGYSGIWDGASREDLPTLATIHPYVIASPDPQRVTPFDPTSPSGWNVFAPGQTVSPALRFTLTAGDAPVRLRLYVTADYGKAADRETRLTPTYALPEFAGKAPWRVLTNITASDLAANDRNSSAILDVISYDWGLDQGIGTDIVDVTAWVPAFGDPEVQPRGTVSVDELSVTNTFTFTNANLNAEGTYWGLVTVRDEATNGLGLLDNLATIFAVPAYNTYALFALAVGPPIIGQPTAVISEPCAEVTYYQAGVPIAFSGVGSFDDVTPPDLLIYEWDTDYDGLVFDIIETGQTMVFTPPDFLTGERTIALRVTDEDSLSGLATWTIRVVAVPGGPLTNATNITNTPDVEEDMGLTQTGFEKNHLIVDDSGRIHLFSLTEFFDCAVTVYDPTGAPTIGPIKLYETQYLYSVPVVEKGPDGTIHLVYMAADRFDDNGYVNPAVGYRTYDPADQTVSAETLIGEWQTPNPYTDANIEHMQGVSFAIDTTGQMVALWEEWWWVYVSGNFDISYAHAMYYTTNDGQGGGWTPATKVPWDIYTANLNSPEIGPYRARPDLTVTPDQTFHTVYVRNPTADEDGPLNLYHRTYDFAGDTWSVERTALDTGSEYSFKQVQLYPAPNGDILALHQKSFDQIFFVRYDSVADSWGPNTLICDDAGAGGIAWQNIPDAHITPDGTVFVAFQALNPSPLPDYAELYFTWFPLTATADEVLAAPKVPVINCFDDEGQREPAWITDEATGTLFLVYENGEGVPENDLWVSSKLVP